MAVFKVCSPDVIYTEEYIESKYIYDTTEVKSENGTMTVHPRETHYTFHTDVKVPKLGCMMVGWGGNNGCTLTAAIIANQKGMSWNTKEGLKVILLVQSNYRHTPISV